MVTSEHVARTIEQKAKKVLKMLKRGVKFTPTQPDVLSILEKTKKQINSRKNLSLCCKHISFVTRAYFIFLRFGRAFSNLERLNTSFMTLCSSTER